MYNLRGEVRQTGVIDFDSNPRRAFIFIDGQLATDPTTGEDIRTPAALSIIEGRRDYVLRLPGYNDASGYIDVFPNMRGNVYRELKPV